jgi:hypothetical protein
VSQNPRLYLGKQQKRLRGREVVEDSKEEVTSSMCRNGFGRLLV